MLGGCAEEDDEEQKKGEAPKRRLSSSLRTGSRIWRKMKRMSSVRICGDRIPGLEMRNRLREVFGTSSISTKSTKYLTSYAKL